MLLRPPLLGQHPDPLLRLGRVISVDPLLQVKDTLRNRHHRSSRDQDLICILVKCRSKDLKTLMPLRNIASNLRLHHLVFMALRPTSSNSDQDHLNLLLLHKLADRHPQVDLLELLLEALLLLSVRSLPLQNIVSDSFKRC